MYGNHRTACGKRAEPVSGQRGEADRRRPFPARKGKVDRLKNIPLPPDERERYILTMLNGATNAAGRRLLYRGVYPDDE